MNNFLRGLRELTTKFKLRKVKSYITVCGDLKRNLPTRLAKIAMSAFFSRYKVAELRLSEAGNKLKERVKPAPAVKPNYQIAYAALKREAESTFVYPFAGQMDAQLRLWDEKLKLSKLQLHKRRVISFGPTHPAAHGILKMLVQFDFEAPVVNNFVGVNLNERQLVFHQPLHFDRTEPFSLALDEMAFHFANKNNLNLGEPNNVGYIQKMFSHVMRKAGPSVGISSAVLDCGRWTLLFWKFEQLAKLQWFCKAASLECIHSTAIIPGCKTTYFPLGFCTDLFEFPCGFIYAVKDIVEMYAEKDSKRNGSEAEFQFQNGLRSIIADRYLNKIKKMRKANEILNQSLENMPNKEIKEGSGKAAPMDQAEIIRSVEELINHFQSYNQTQNITILKKYMGHLAEQRIYGVAGVGWYMISFPQYYPFRKTGNDGKADK